MINDSVFVTTGWIQPSVISNFVHIFDIRILNFAAQTE